ncbi:MAG: hypothetical protein GEU91_22165 [Rhizobiales bacterium]|nr:hypothetical protein [Hyphomicrobiales bacterium]
MHRRLREVEALLREWCRSDYGAHWLSVATQERGVIRVKPGQFIPVVHFVALADRPVFIAPQQAVRAGHRMVGSDEFRSGRPLEDGELALRPEIRLDVVQDRALLAAAARGDTSARVADVKEPSLVFSAPARFLIAPTAWPRKAYVLYQHIFGEGPSYPDDGFFYVGVTTRSWQKRWMEHRRAMETGSPLLFHRTLREELSAGRATYIHHKVMGITDDLERLYATEEWLVERHWADTRRLNMIPGGKSGLKYLRENGMLAERVTPLPDERDRLVETWLRDHPRKGLPTPWVTEKWKDDEWAIAQICGRDDRLSVEQVRAIRELSKAYSAEAIAERIGARTKEQVQRVIDGETYTRVV